MINKIANYLWHSTSCIKRKKFRLLLMKYGNCIGPYSIWHHEHKLETIEGGVLMTDIVSYKPPFGFIGSIVNAVLIKKQLREIFDYRKKAIDKMFGEMK